MYVFVRVFEYCVRKRWPVCVRVCRYVCVHECARARVCVCLCVCDVPMYACEYLSSDGVIDSLHKSTKHEPYMSYQQQQYG